MINYNNNNNNKQKSSTNLTTEYNLYLNDHSSIINSPFNQNLSTKFIIHGWTHGKEAHWVKEIREGI